MVGAGVGLGIAHISSHALQQEQKDNEAKKQIKNFKDGVSYREVAKTGIYVSALSIGTGKCNYETLDASIKSGINLIHTSARYMGGKSLETVGKAIKDRTDKVHVALKDNFSSIEKTFKILGVKSVDFMMWNRHNAGKFRKEIPAIKKQFLEWRDKGLVKFAGLTTHNDTKACIDVALEAGFFSCIMPSLGPSQFTELKATREAIYQKGLSIISMKTKGELKSEAFKTQIATVLSDPAVCTINKGILSIDDLEAWAPAAWNARSGFWIKRTMENRALTRPYDGCNLCGKCQAACPNNVSTADIVRCTRYYLDSERTPDVATEQFNELNCAQSLVRCRQCGACETVCPQKLSIRNELKRASGLWS
jgi:predicted aldo/keto reductase-like oxidoreductase